MTDYICPKCGKSFGNKKTDLTRHMQKKIDCTGKSLEDTVKDVVKKVVKEEVKEILPKLIKKDQTAVILNLVDQLHNLMRTRDSIVGTKAFHDISRLLFLRFIQPHLTGHLKTLVDIDLYKTLTNNFELFEAAGEDAIKYIDIYVLNKLRPEDDEDDFNLRSILNIVWKGLLAVHPLTKYIFTPDTFFHCKHKTLKLCIVKIIQTLQKIDFDHLENDIKGLMFEKFVNGYADKGGKEFGQFFTPRSLIHLVFQLNKELYPNFKPTNVYDPCAGSCGFLTEAHKEYEIPGENVYGGELEAEAYTSGLMNLLLTTGDVSNYRKCNSLHDNRLKMFDFITANPPFGHSKDINFIEINENLEVTKPIIKPPKRGEKKKKEPATRTCFELDELYPFQSKEISALFLQHCIAKLENGGVCNIVLPDGQLMVGKNFKKLREYLVDNCVLSAVLSIPNGVFTYAGVATVVLFFSMHPENNTETVKFYETNVDCKEFKFNGEVSYEELEAKNYVLSWKYYKKVEIIQIDTTFELKTLDTICEFLPKRGKYNSSAGQDEGKYRFYSCADGYRFIDKCEYNELCLLINGGGVANVRIDDEFSTSGDVIVMKCDDDITTKYVYYYLKTHLELLDQYMKGSTIKHMSRENLSLIQIPIPLIETQKYLVGKCDIIVNAINQTRGLINSLRECIRVHAEIADDVFTKRGIEKKTFGEICKFLPSSKVYNSSDGHDEGKYKFYSCADEIKFVDKCEYKNLSILINAGSGSGKTKIRMDKEFTASGHVIVVNCDTETATKYLYYYLCTHIDLIEQNMHGSTIKMLTKENLSNMQIFILPSEEGQQKIIDIYDQKYKQIKDLEEGIKPLEEQLNKLIDGYIQQPTDD